MEIESQVVHDNSNKLQEAPGSSTKRLSPLLFLNLSFLVIGCGGMPLLLRLYFLHGGHLIWFSTFLQTAAFPLLLPAVLISNSNKPQLFSLTTRPVLLSCTALGFLTGLVNLFYAYGLSYVPVSTSSLLLSTQLSFTALFSFLFVKQRFTPFSINAVVLLTVGAVVLGVNSAGDRPEGVDHSKYYFGFAMTLGAAVLDGLLPTLSELMYKKAGQPVTYTMVLETQVVMGFFATAFCAVGMLLKGEFQAISREAEQYGLGETNYYLVITSFAVVMQCFFLGRVGVVLYSSALFTGVVVDVLLPVTVFLAVIFFHEPFTGDKAVALVLSIWGFVSYIYGEMKDLMKRKKNAILVESPIPVLRN